MKFLTAHLRPAEGRRVRHADGRVFAAKGETVPSSSYYRRLVDAGDLEPVPSRKPRASKPSKGSKTA